MGECLLGILFWGIFVGGGTVFVVFCFVMAIRQYKRDVVRQKETVCEKDPVSTQNEFTVDIMKATVVEQMCLVKTIGIRSPKTIKMFFVVFQTENGEILKIDIPEEMYEGFAQGQTGLLSLVDGELYSFEPEE